MKADYKNWVPNGMTAGFAAATAALAAGAVLAGKAPVKPVVKPEPKKELAPGDFVIQSKGPGKAKKLAKDKLM